jgi:FtsH-binding integral membrane protein|uniref:Uncharacterized protein n=1 Tax=Siphoviridae sp. ctGuJ10 TaxID=2825418 RepID=A0A8S5PST5_9CAUD|nr:MAG TPA: hypothetical protein [Siphoviridae sp. ctGuJ10]
MDKNIERYKLLNGIKKMKSFGSILLLISFLCLMMIFIGVLIFIWYGKIGLKITISSILILIFSELLRISANELCKDYAEKLIKLSDDL